MRVDPLLRSDVNNAHYNSNTNAIDYGVASTGKSMGEDAVLIVHEYGHAILDEMVPGLLLQPEGQAYHESFGDILAFLVTLDHRTGDVGCMAEWLFGRCARNLNSSAHFPEDRKFEEHVDSAFTSGAVFQITTDLLAEAGLDIESCGSGDDCTDVRDRVLTTVISANEFLTPQSTLPDIAAAFERANKILFDGEDAELIAAAFDERGLGTPGNETVDQGGQTGSAPRAVVDVDITHPSRGELAVAVGVLDENFTQLCTAVSLLAPNPADTNARVKGRVDVSNSECADFLPPSPDQQWVLAVIDDTDGNAGEINSFKVIADGVPFLATGVPQPIADNDPQGTIVLIDGSGARTRDNNQEDIESDTSSTGTASVTASIAITHSNIGDLSVRAGVADASSKVLCSVDILEPDPTDVRTSAAGDVDLSKCASLYPPTADHRWFLEVIDTAAADTGTVDAFTVTGPDGTHESSAPIAIPDNDPTGVALLVS
jgi:subtilisin-like proprotein convertase family protein